MASTAVVSVALAIALVITAIGLLSFLGGVRSLIRDIRSGPPDHTRSRPVARRLWNTVWTVLSHSSFKGRPVVKVAHWVVMFSFVVLALTLVSSYGQIRNPGYVLPFIGKTVVWYWLAEFSALLGLVGIVALMIIRSIVLHRAADPRQSRFYGSTGWQGRFVEWVIFIVCACVLLLHAFEYAYSAKTDGDTIAALSIPLTWPLGNLFLSWSPAALANAIVITAAVKIVVSMSWMIVVGVQTTMGVSWHRFLAPFNIYAGRNADGSKALGPLVPLLSDGQYLDNLDEAPEDSTFGLGETEDLTWKDRLDLLSCTECGRCQAVCPAWNTDKPLSPKLLTLALRDNAASASQIEFEATDGAPAIESGVRLSPDSFDIRTALASDGVTVAAGNAALVPDVLGEQMIWDCTMCGACVEQCPVDIEHVDHIANLRRFQVLMESAFPKELSRPFKSMQTKGNPYGRPARARLDWAKHLDFEVPVIGQDIEDATEVDYLFWVGCAGAYDDNQKKTTAAVAELLHTAGVSFAVLGSAESCTGDAARRAGNEALFQILASAAIDTLNEAKAQRIVVTCAHCFNTIGREFPQLDGNFDVIHHTQLLNRLVREGLLTPVAPDEPTTITYHDPCFLGRHNRVFEAPRQLLGSLPGVTNVEMTLNRENATCCGAGGARAWMEETGGTRISTMRMDQAEATGAATVATACPFCTQMLKSAPGFSDAPEVKDVAVLLAEAVRRGQQ